MILNKTRPSFSADRDWRALQMLGAFALTLALASCSERDVETGTGSDPDPVEAQAPAAGEAGAPGAGEEVPDAAAVDQAFTRIMEEHWDWAVSQSPVFATSLGVREYDTTLSDPSLVAYERSIEQQRGFLDRLEAIESAYLGEEARLNFRLLTSLLRTEIEEAQFGGKYMLITNRGGPHLEMADLPDRLPFFTHADYESYVARLGRIGSYMQAATERLRAGLAADWRQPCSSMAGYETSIGAHIVDDIAQSKFMKPFEDRPESIGAAAFEGLKTQAAFEIGSSVVPAFRAFRGFYMTEYAPACNTVDGTHSLPEGEAYYAHRAQRFTTTDMTPEEIHQKGLDEVARIRAEMEEVIREAEFDGSFQEWVAYLRSNPEFYPKTAEERMMRVAHISKKMDGLLPKLFTKFPRMPYGLKEIPLDIAEKTTTAYYWRPAGDGSRAGFYYVNTTRLDTRPIYELEALSLHEAVPGHHFQIALAQELDMPPFRRYGGQTAFVEGWGLYAERLGLEVGFYETPFTNFGRLSYEMWRACRLVVDTGIHAKEWSRQRAIDYMLENSALSENNIVTEIDRYITWPGQALAYKIGELKIRELRARAEEALGPSFDVRLFHDAVLSDGALPLTILEEQMDAWIERQQG